jgi:hypothetical protein
MNRRESLAKLGTFFPAGGTAEKLSGYLLQLDKARFHDDDIEAAAEELIETRDAHNYPPYALLGRACSKAKHSRMMADSAYRDRDGPTWLCDERIGDGVCQCEHTIGMHGPAEGSYGEPMISGSCRRCNCAKYKNKGKTIIPEYDEGVL